MGELTNRIDLAREYADHVSTQAPGFYLYAERVIRAWANGTQLDDRSQFNGTQADKNLRAILRGAL